uniref:Na_Ca_ex domain-containing protein n=1 Tax=Macrostomum lignano TaxID=282301 RepID=A0A1I8FHV9_9PLAT
MRSRSDIQQNVGAVYANDNRPSTPRWKPTPRRVRHLADFPEAASSGPSGRVEDGRVARKPSRLDERMKRVSRVQMQRSCPYRPGVPFARPTVLCPAAGSGRKWAGKVSTGSFTGVERAGQLSERWMLCTETWSRWSTAADPLSQVSHDGPSERHAARRAPPARSVARTAAAGSAPQQPRRKAVSDSYRPGTSSGGGGGGSSGQCDDRPGYKAIRRARMRRVKMNCRPRLVLSAASAYFQKKESEQQARKALEAAAEEDENRKRQLYRIESVDEALDDDTVDRLNRLNEQRMMEERQRSGREREAAAAAQEAAAAERQDAGEDDEVDENQSPIKEFLYSLVPAPLLFLLLLSTPFVDYDDQPLNGWSRILNSVHCCYRPGGGGFPIVVIVLIVGIALGILVYFTSSDFEPPKYHAAFAFIGFLTAIVWIYTFANEVVNILESVGSIFRISSTILGSPCWPGRTPSEIVCANTGLGCWPAEFPPAWLHLALLRRPWAVPTCCCGVRLNLSDGTTEMRIEASVVQLLLVVSGDG